ncbi:hypothetical protein BXZ70DRAFT_631480 [Cristinia sonorae]|uniref:Uncharacterized protein n=1 Tax=Cristinia sonorae TaxID=1940300 RepID=A0A8K0UEK3_9AGAR|nr:hypothetical protein BXZ70DRAFT_631480 [Cristinia sonorae]
MISDGAAIVERRHPLRVPDGRIMVVSSYHASKSRGWSRKYILVIESARRGESRTFIIIREGQRCSGPQARRRKSDLANIGHLQALSMSRTMKEMELPRAKVLGLAEVDEPRVCRLQSEKRRRVPESGFFLVFFRCQEDKNACDSDGSEDDLDLGSNAVVSELHLEDPLKEWQSLVKEISERVKKRGAILQYLPFIQTVLGMEEMA